ncbi:hypothetical protein COO60DRAFT_1500982 [Scenedesmus sp. NREL 46B-D3]|nr:hypothetical protein COO60DRAFT_1500982 [Scenedesmus sp. NREL 46B-D3]
MQRLCARKWWQAAAAAAAAMCTAAMCTAAAVQQQAVDVQELLFRRTAAAAMLWGEVCGHDDVVRLVWRIALCAASEVFMSRAGAAFCADAPASLCACGQVC